MIQEARDNIEICESGFSAGISFRGGYSCCVELSGDRRKPIWRTHFRLDGKPISKANVALAIN